MSHNDDTSATLPVASTSASKSESSPNEQSQPAKLPKSVRGRPADDDAIRHSKTLSYILRHGAAKESLLLRPDGFVRVDDLLKRPKLKALDFEALQRIVRDNEKQRFTLQIEPTGKDGKEEFWIRANQGHSVKVESLELTPVTDPSQIPIMVHGTNFQLWKKISQEGLRVMTRNHVHCAIGLADDKAVKSGMRKNCDLFVYLNVPAMLADSIPIFQSSNRVLLTAGIEGVVPPKYFAKVERKLKGEIVAVEFPRQTGFSSLPQ